ncbi:MAG: hypothetical protein R3C56_37510 [Pirellulaceae bacterium]
MEKLSASADAFGTHIAALATAIAAVVSLQGISLGFTRSFGEIYTAHSVDIVVSRAGSADRLSSSIDQRFSEEIAKLPEGQPHRRRAPRHAVLEDEGVYGIPAMGIARDSWIRRDYEIQRARKTEVNPNDRQSESE